MRVAGATEGHLRVKGASLYVRQVGHGPPVVVVHGGPDFDHYYLRPELDALADAVRLVYYDQRGRGRSSAGVDPGGVSLDSEIDDLEGLRQSLGLASVALLGHSWGGLLAMEYAVRHPERVSHLVLMNTAPASYDDWRTFREQLRDRRTPEDLQVMEAVADSAAYRAGDLDAEAAYYRVHFRVAVHTPEVAEAVVSRLRVHFTPEGVLTARAIEDRLYQETASKPGYDLLPGLHRSARPTLVVHGEEDFVPREAVARIADAVPGGKLSVLPGCGHFAYLERPRQVHREVTEFVR